MNPVEARYLAVALLHQHGLANWKLKLGRGRWNAGLCHFDRHTIELSEPFVQANTSEKVRDLVLHEIAHAIADRVRHDAVWKATAKMLGCKAEPRPDLERPPGKWKLVCDHCGHAVHRVRKPDGRRRSCRICGGAKFNPRYVLREVV